MLDIVIPELFFLFLRLFGLYYPEQIDVKNPSLYIQKMEFCKIQTNRPSGKKCFEKNRFELEEINEITRSIDKSESLNCIKITKKNYGNRICYEISY